MNYNNYKPSTNNRKGYILHETEKKFRNISPKLPKLDMCLKSSTKVTCPISSKTYNFTVKLFQSRCQIRKTNRTMAKISKYSILENKNTGRDICNEILNTNIGLKECYRNVKLNDVILTLSPILELFKNRHNRFNYFDKLKCIIAEDSKKYVPLKFKHQIHIHSLQSFFGLLVYKNVPFELFGTLRNQKAIKKTISRLLKTDPCKISITSAFKRTVQRAVVTGSSLDIEPLFKKLDISKIKWLRVIDNAEIQQIIILKLLHWFFAQYIIKILHKYVVLTAIKKQWIYITKDDWCNMQEEYINEKIKSGRLKPYKKLNNIGKYKFIPSSSGLRALFLTKYNFEERYDRNDIILRFLQQLYITYFNENGIPTIAGCKNAIRNFIKLRSKIRLYFVRCDIQDAFGSIIQRKLCDIIDMYCQQTMKERSYVSVENCILKRPKKKQNRIKKYTVQILFEYLKRLTQKDINSSKEKAKFLKKAWITHNLYKLIFGQQVKLNGRIYTMKDGVPQGLSSSSILSHIYYQHMMKEIFSEYADNGLLTIYVDDILYITENQHYAIKFLEIIRNGIPEYNVKFNENKTQSNVGVPCTPIKFLRWKVPINRIR